MQYKLWWCHYAFQNLRCIPEPFSIEKHWVYIIHAEFPMAGWSIWDCVRSWCNIDRNVYATHKPGFDEQIYSEMPRDKWECTNARVVNIAWLLYKPMPKLCAVHMRCIWLLKTILRSVDQQLFSDQTQIYMSSRPNYCLTEKLITVHGWGQLRIIRRWKCYGGASSN